MFRQDSGADKIDYLRQAIDRSRIVKVILDISRMSVASGEHQGVNLSWINQGLAKTKHEAR